MTNPANFGSLDSVGFNAALAFGLPGLGAFGASKLASAAMGQEAQKTRMAGEKFLKPGTPYIDSEGKMKIWGGDAYGPQSVESWTKLTGGKPNVNIEMGRARGALPTPQKAPPLNLPKEPPIPGGGTDFSKEVDKGQSIEDPNFVEILKILKATTDPSTVSRLEDERLKRILTANEALSRESRLKGEEISRRQESLKRIEQWGAIEQTRLTANAVGMANFAQVAYLAGVPNVNVIDAMTRGTQAALAPLQFKLGVRT